jgi:hypothetical protein
MASRFSTYNPTAYQSVFVPETYAIQLDYKILTDRQKQYEDSEALSG